MTEADEAASSKAVALANLREQVEKRETAGVVAMYEVAAWNVGATVAETDAAMKAGRLRPYTSVYFCGSTVERTVIRAESEAQALRYHEESGPNAYDERVLLPGDVPLDEVTRQHGTPEALYGGWKLDRY